MKKLLIIAIMIAVFSCALFAQELKFDGYFNSGIGLVVNDNEDNKVTVKAYGADAAHAGYRFRLNGSYTNEAKTVGAKFRFQSQTNLGAGYFSLPYALGWVNFLDNIFSINAGIIEDNTWSTGDFWLASDSVSDFAGLGSLLKITPIEGLSFGFGFYPVTRKGGGDNNTLHKITSIGDSIIWNDAKYTVHVGYTLKDVFRVSASWRNENKAGDIPSSDLNPNKPVETSKIYGEFRYLGVKELTAVAAIMADNVGEYFKGFDAAAVSNSNGGNIVISETFGYKVDANFNLGLNTVQFLYNRTDVDGKKIDVNPGLFFNLWGSYAIDKIVPRLDLVYFIGGRSKAVNSGNRDAWDRGAFANQAKAKDAAQDLSVFSARPSVKFNIDSKTFIEIGDMVNYDFGNFTGAYKDSKDADKKSRLTNVCYVDLKWSF